MAERSVRKRFEFVMMDGCGGWKLTLYFGCGNLGIWVSLQVARTGNILMSKRGRKKKFLCEARSKVFIAGRRSTCVVVGAARVEGSRMLVRGLSECREGTKPITGWVRKQVVGRRIRQQQKS